MRPVSKYCQGTPTEPRPRLGQCSDPTRVRFPLETSGSGHMTLHCPVHPVRRQHKHSCHGSMPPQDPSHAHLAILSWTSSEGQPWDRPTLLGHRSPILHINQELTLEQAGSTALLWAAGHTEDAWHTRNTPLLARRSTLHRVLRNITPGQGWEGEKCSSILRKWAHIGSQCRLQGPHNPFFNGWWAPTRL